MLDGMLSLVIPAHNEAENIGAVIQEACRVLPGLADEFEIVLVDDGSTDGTAALALRAANDSAGRLRVIRHETKSGALVAVRDGLQAARGAYVGYVDGDGQFRVADLVPLAMLLNDADLVGGWRLRRADPWFRKIVSETFNLLVRLVYGLPYRDIDCGIKLMRRPVLTAAMPFMARSACLNAELYFKARRSGLRVAQAPVPHYPRVAGVRSGGRLGPITRAVTELVRLRWRLAFQWHPASPPSGAPPLG